MTDWIYFKYCYWCCGIRFKIKSEWKTIKLIRKICKGRTVPYWPYFKWWRTWLIFSIFCHVKFGFSSPNFLVTSFTFTFSSFSHSLLSAENFQCDCNLKRRACLGQERRAHKFSSRYCEFQDELEIISRNSNHCLICALLVLLDESIVFIVIRIFLKHVEIEAFVATTVSVEWWSCIVIYKKHSFC